MARAWYAYQGRGDIEATSSYSFVSVPPSCRNGLNLCAISLKDGTGNPIVISTNVRQYIFNALVRGVPQPEGLNVKPYVYLKLND